MTQTLPHNKDAERYILGGIILDNELFLQTLDKISAEDFFITSHKPIYQAMEHLYDAGAEINHVTVTEALKTLGVYNSESKTDVAELLQSLVRGVPKSSDITYYVHVLKERSRERKKLKLSADLTTALYNGDTVTVDSIENELSELSMERKQDGLQPLGDSVGTGVLQKAHSRGVTGTKLIGYPTGILELDKETLGLNRQEVMVLAARPAMGKTAISLNIATYMTNLGYVVAMFSMEMSREALYIRLIASIARLDLHRLKSGTLTKVEWARAIHAHDTITNSNLLIDTTPLLTPRALETEVKKAKRRYGKVDMIIVDYIQLMDSNTKKESRQQEVTEISRQLRETAKRQDCAMIALSQLSRAPENRPANKHRPQMSDLRESGCISGAALVTLQQNGERVRLDSLVGRKNFYSVSLDVDSKVQRTGLVTNVFCTGLKQTYKLKTHLGRTISVTANHKFLTPDGWKRLDELTIGEYVATPAKIDLNIKGQIKDEELLLLAHLIGDGCLLERHSNQYTTGKLELAELVASVAKTLFKEDICPRIVKERTWYQVYLASTKKHTHGVSSSITEWAKKYGIYGRRAKEKIIPEILFQCSNEQICWFIKHLWSTDGHVSLSRGKKNGNFRSSIFYSSSSYKLIHQLQYLLTRVGIKSIINKPIKNNYTLHIRTRKSTKDFITLIGAVDIENKARIKEINANLEKTIPFIFKFKDVERDILWDKVSTIEADKIELVYDMTVPEFSNFEIANIWLHNSIEQDADIVAMLYREEVYNPDAVKGAAELIITKSRNTALINIDLFYVKTQTRFENVFIS